MSNNDQVLITRAKNGEVRAFEELLRHHEKTLYRFALGITGGDEHLAADLLQEALIKAFINIKSFRESSQFTSWLWRIVKNEFLSYHRSPQRQYERQPTLDPENMSHDSSRRSLETELLLDDQITRLRTAIDELPELYREVVYAVELMEMSYDQAAEYLGIPEGSIKSRLSRAKEKLEKELKKMEPFAKNKPLTGSSEVEL